MEDWTGYCNNLEIELINAPQATHWDASYSFINGTDPFDVAQALAVNHWMTSDVAVLAPIMDTPMATPIVGEDTITLEAVTPNSFSLMIAEPDGIGGVYESFVIQEPYVYVEVNLD